MLQPNSSADSAGLQQFRQVGDNPSKSVKPFVADFVGNGCVNEESSVSLHAVDVVYPLRVQRSATFNVRVNVNGVTINMDLDTGAEISIASHILRAVTSSIAKTGNGVTCDSRLRYSCNRSMRRRRGIGGSTPYYSSVCYIKNSTWTF